MIIGGTQEIEKHMFLTPLIQAKKPGFYMTETTKMFIAIQEVFKEEKYFNKNVLMIL